MYRTRSMKELEEENSRLKWLLEDLEETRRRDHERHVEDLRRRNQENHQQWLEAQYHADTWPEAFGKALPRIFSEAHHEELENARIANNPEYEGETSSNFFTKYLEEVKEAQEIFNQLVPAYEKDVAAVRRTFCKLWAETLALKVGETELVEAIRADNPEYLVNW